jgi:hypothetical protein
MKTSKICYCREQSSSKMMPGYCSTCHGTLSDTPEGKIKPSTLEELLSLKSQFLENAYLKTLKVMKIFKSSSSPTLPDNQKHKRSNTSNKLIKSKDTVPEEGPGINKINSLHTESHPNTRSVPYLAIGTLKSSVMQKPKELSLNMESTKPISYKNFVTKHHDRAFSSRIENSIYESDSWLKPQSALSNYSDANKSQVHKESSSFRFAGHANSVNCLTFAQGRLFSAGSDYKILAWPRIDPLYVAQGKLVGPSSGFKALARPLRALATCAGRLLVSAGDCRAIKIWSYSRDFDCVQVLKSPDQCTKCLLAAGKQILSAGSSGLVHLWDVEEKCIVKSHPASWAKVNNLVEFSNNLFLSAGNDGVVSLIDFRCIRNVANFTHCEEVNAVLFDKGQSFYSAADKFRVRAM